MDKIKIKREQQAIADLVGRVQVRLGAAGWVDGARVVVAASDRLIIPLTELGVRRFRRLGKILKPINPHVFGEDDPPKGFWFWKWARVFFLLHVRFALAALPLRKGRPLDGAERELIKTLALAHLRSGGTERQIKFPLEYSTGDMPSRFTILNR